ncbi:hypothetical protein NXY07_21990 [Phocaeicola dorei]|nr:hypothetical protein [Phocaeicola dorei]
MNRLKKRKGRKWRYPKPQTERTAVVPGSGHDEWWERLMMEPGSGESAGTDAEPVIPSGAGCGRGVRGSGKKGHPAGTGRPREKKDERQAA